MRTTPWFVAIGASGAQGLNDIQNLLAALPRTFGAAVLVVLHRPWEHISQLHAVLSRGSALPVTIAQDGEQFCAGTVYIGEPADHLTMAARCFGELVEDPDRKYGNRTVDLLFASVAAHGGKNVIGVVLSGALDDGSRGLAAIHYAGGKTMVMTPVPGLPGMPENAIGYDGPIDTIGSAAAIARALIAAVDAPGRRVAEP